MPHSGSTAALQSFVLQFGRLGEVPLSSGLGGASPAEPEQYVVLAHSTHIFEPPSVFLSTH